LTRKKSFPPPASPHPKAFSHFHLYTHFPPTANPFVSPFFRSHFLPPNVPTFEKKEVFKLVLPLSPLILQSAQPSPESHTPLLTRPFFFPPLAMLRKLDVSPHLPLRQRFLKTIFNQSGLLCPSFPRKIDPPSEKTNPLRFRPAPSPPVPPQSAPDASHAPPTPSFHGGRSALFLLCHQLVKFARLFSVNLLFLSLPP